MQRIEDSIETKQPVWSKLTILRSNNLYTIVIVLAVVTALLPAFIYATVSYYRARTQQQTIVSTQLADLSAAGVQQVQEFALNRRAALDKLAGDSSLINLLTEIVQNGQYTPDEQAAQSLGLQKILTGPAAGAGEMLFDDLLVLDPNGQAVATSNDPWLKSTFTSLPGDHPALFVALKKGEPSTFLFDPFPPFNDQYVLMTLRKLKLTSLPGEYTLLAFTSAPLPAVVLKQSAAFYTGARAYFYDNQSGLLLGPGSGITLISLSDGLPVLTGVAPVLKGASPSQLLHYDSLDHAPVTAFARRVPDLNLVLILEVPARSISIKTPLLDIFSIPAIVISLVVLAFLVHLGRVWVVIPLRELNLVARDYAQGMINHRLHLRRRDEIGQLADSLDRLGQDLDNHTSIMQDRIEHRTAQLITAAEIAGLAAAYTAMEDVAEKAVQLINERFGFYHTALYLAEEGGKGITLLCASGEHDQRRKRHSRRVLLAERTLAGQAVQHNETHLVADLAEKVEDLPEARAQAAIPIATEGKVLGALEIFSSRANTFDADTLFVLKTLANQVAVALQNSRLRSPGQSDTEELAFLFNLTRQLTDTTDEKAINDLILKALAQFPHTCAFLTVEQANLHILGLYDAHAKKYEGFLNKIDIPAANYIDEIAVGIPIFVGDISQPNTFDNVLSFFLRRGCKSAAMIPCIHNGKVARLLILGFLEDEYVNQARLQPYYHLVEMITNALGRSTAQLSLQLRLNELQTLATFTKSTAQESDINQLFRILHEQAAKVLGSDVGFLVAVYQSQTNQFTIPYAYENNAPIALQPVPFGQGLISYVAQTQQPLLLSKDTETLAVELGARVVGKLARSWMGIPLIAANGLMGVMVFQDPQRENRFSEAHLSLFQSLATTVAMAIRSAQLVDQLTSTGAAFEKERLLIDTWLTNTPDLVTIKNSHGQYLRASKPALESLGQSASQLAGKSDYDLFERDIAARSIEEELLILAEGRPRFDAVEKNSLNGKDAWFSTSKIPVIGAENQSTELISIRRDITSWKLAEQEARKRAEEILTSAEISREATSRLDIIELLDKSVQLIRARFDLRQVAVYLLDGAGEALTLRASNGDDQLPAILRFDGNPDSPSAVCQACARSETVIRNAQEPADAPALLAEMAVPLKIGDRILGALDAHSAEPGAFADEMIPILGILADQIAIAVNNAELFAITQKTLGKHRLLHDITVAATTSPNLEESLFQVATRLVAASEADRAAIFLLKRDSLEPAAADGYADSSRPTALNMAKVFATIALKQRHLVLVKESRSQNGADDQNETITRAQLAMPILFGEEVLGVLNLESNQSTAFTENDQEIISALVNSLGAVVANWRLVNQIRRQVERQEALFNATARIRQSTDIATILQTSVAEIGKAMGAHSARIKLAEETALPASLNPAARNELTLASQTQPSYQNGKDGEM